MRFSLLMFLALAASAAENPFAAHEAAIAGRLAEMLAPVARPATVVDAPPAQADEPVLAGAWARIARLRPAIEPLLKAEGLPVDLLAVALVESGGDPMALSPKQARGLWQFIPETARRYGLTVAGAADDRLHIERSTRAAARYLRDLYAQFGQWPLALAAYNAGEAAVAKAVARAGSADFAAVGRLLSPETRNYVPAVLAAMRALRESAPASNRAAVD